MRRLLLLALCFASLMAQAGVGGFESLEWDMTKQAVSRLYPNFEEWTEDDLRNR
jgi:hypothetical protein